MCSLCGLCTRTSELCHVFRDSIVVEVYSWCSRCRRCCWCLSFIKVPAGFIGTSALDVNIHTCGVYLSLAVREIRVDTWHGWPIPDPVKSIWLARGSICWKRNVVLTPEIGAHELIRLMRILRLSCSGDIAAVDLVTYTIIVWLGRKKYASLVTTSACCVPLLEYIEE